MGKTTTLTRHAISPPTFESTKVHRERLVDTIHANLPRKLIAVIAPAGYGKTTLLSDFASHTEVPVCWLRLTEADRDVMRMASVLQASLTSRFRRLKKTLRVDAMANADESAVAAAFARVIVNGVDEPFVLIVDDVHLVNPSRSVMRFWTKFFEVQPENMTVIMAGREVPNLPLDDLLAKNRVAGIGPLELSLTTAELVELSQRAMGRALGEAEAERLQKETGGWVMGVLLSGALPVAGLGVLVQSPRPMVYDYLAAVVLNRQSPSLRKFLLHSSVLPVMTAEACDEVLDKRGSGRVLNDALRSGLFLSSTGERPRTYEYHPQFREFLLATLGEEDPRMVSQLCGRAGAYLAQRVGIEQAIDLYLCVGLKNNATKLIAIHARAIRRQGKWETLRRWRNSFGEHDWAWGELTLEMGTSLADRGMLREAKEMFRRAGACARLVRSKAMLIRSLSGRASVAFFDGSYSAARRFAKRAESQSRDLGGLVRADAIRYLAISDSVLRPRDPKNLGALERAVRIAVGESDRYAATVFSIDLAETADRLGLWERAIEETRRLEDAADVEALRGLRPQLLVYLCAADMYEGKLDAAFERSMEAEQAALEAANVQWFVQSMCLRAHVLGLLGQTSDALRSLDCGERHCQSAGLPSLIGKLLDMRIDVLQWRGRIDDARDAARRYAALPLAVDVKQWSRMRVELAETWGNEGEIVARLGKHLAGNRRRVDMGEKAYGHWFLAKAKRTLADHIGHGRSLAIALDGARSPMLALWLASDLSFDSEYGDYLLERHGGNATIQRLELLATAFRKARRNREGPPAGHRVATIEVSAFGPTASVRKAGEEVLLRPLDRVLLVLLMEGETSRLLLEEALWPGGSHEQQSANLHSAIYRLRCALGGRMVLTEGAGYKVASGQPIKYDVADFRQILELVTRPSGQGLMPWALARQAIEMYKAGFLSSSTVPWACRRRADLETLFLTLCRILAESCVSLGRFDEAETVLSRALALDSCSDNLVEMLLEVIALQGKWGTLSKTYGDYSDRLREQLGLDPSISIRRKYEAILNGAFPADPIHEGSYE